MAGHDSETAPVVPRPTSGESSRKRPIEDEEDLLEDVRYQREYGLVSNPVSESSFGLIFPKSERLANFAFDRSAALVLTSLLLKRRP